MNKKEAILKAAIELLTEKGVHNTPMSAIAKAAGTGMGTIYNYFPEKGVLINEIYVQIKKEEAAVYSTFEEGKPMKTQFETYFASIINFFTEHPLYFKFMDQLQASPIITAESKAAGAVSIDPVFQLLEKGKQERIIKSIATEELLVFIGGVVLSYLRWYFDQSKTGDKPLANQVQMIWDAIKE